MNENTVCGCACVCSDIVHMTCRSVAVDAQSDLKPVAELLLNTSCSDDGLAHDSGLWQDSDL